MANEHKKLADSLAVLAELQATGKTAIRSVELSRSNRERLLTQGFLQEVMKGWYVPSQPNEMPGDSSAWYASYWQFCSDYLRTRFSDSWCLSPEHSLALHVGDRTVPQQLIVRSPTGGNTSVKLLHGTSLLDIRGGLPATEHRSDRNGMNVYSLPAALLEVPATYFQRKSSTARAALAGVSDPSQLLGLLLSNGHSVIAGRIAGAFRNVGRHAIADEIVSAMRAAGFAIREDDPFLDTSRVNLPARGASPYAARMQLMWSGLREQVLGQFTAKPSAVTDVDAYLQKVGDAFVTDAYHSLSIEGYRVSPALIERIRSGGWNPGAERDLDEHNAMAARGYWQAHQAVLRSVRAVLEGQNSGALAAADHRDWYRELFAPSVTAGLLKASDLAGYRTGPVYIRGSRHVPMPAHAVPESMTTFFDLLDEESDAAVRSILGHFIFVYIHPYVDGNGRMARFLMNLMLAAGGYPWTVIPLGARSRYMSALEAASVKQDIREFAGLISELIQADLPAIPTDDSAT